MSKNFREIAFPCITNEAGFLSYLQNNDQIPFEIACTRLMYDIVQEQHSGYASPYKNELIVALKGSFDVRLFDGSNEYLIKLHKPDVGLYIPNLIWINIENVSSDSVILVVSDKESSETELINDRQHFIETKKNEN